MRWSWRSEAIDPGFDQGAVDHEGDAAVAESKSLDCSLDIQGTTPTLSSSSFMRRRLPKMKKVAKSMEAHLGGLLTYFTHRITNALTEAFNSKILAKKPTPVASAASITTAPESSSSAATRHDSTSSFSRYPRENAKNLFLASHQLLAA